MNIRKAIIDDIPRIMEICEEAREIMRSDGNMMQWTDGYPSEDIIRSDIGSSVGYVIENGCSIEGYFAFIFGIEKTYREFECGRWVNDGEPYATIHRLASSKNSHGIAQDCFNWCWEQIHSLRIDTHEHNRIMRHCIEKFGFCYCGIIHLQNGDPRLAYQKVSQMKSL